MRRTGEQAWLGRGRASKTDHLPWCVPVVLALLLRRGLLLKVRRGVLLLLLVVELLLRLLVLLLRLLLVLLLLLLLLSGVEGRVIQGGHAMRVRRRVGIEESLDVGRRRGEPQLAIRRSWLLPKLRVCARLVSEEFSEPRREGRTR